MRASARILASVTMLAGAAAVGVVGSPADAAASPHPSAAAAALPNVEWQHGQSYDPHGWFGDQLQIYAGCAIQGNHGFTCFTPDVEASPQGDTPTGEVFRISDTSADGYRVAVYWETTSGNARRGMCYNAEGNGTDEVCDLANVPEGTSYRFRLKYCNKTASNSCSALGDWSNDDRLITWKYFTDDMNTKNDEWYK